MRHRHSSPPTEEEEHLIDDRALFEQDCTRGENAYLTMGNEPVELAARNRCEERYRTETVSEFGGCHGVEIFTALDV
jgi:hypothetical protein